jgi:hypothetical protein
MKSAELHHAVEGVVMNFYCTCLIRLEYVWFNILIVLLLIIHRVWQAGSFCVILIKKLIII